MTEAVGHFHLYRWLKDAVGRRCIVSPEFPTGNGKIDLHLHCADKRGIIEVKSFQDKYQLQKDHTQAALYAKNLGLQAVTLAVFVQLAACRRKTAEVSNRPLTSKVALIMGLNC